MNSLAVEPKKPPEDSLQRADVKYLGSPKARRGTPASSGLGSISGNFLEKVCLGHSHRRPT